jgi:hypothetical protein
MKYRRSVDKPIVHSSSHSPLHVAGVELIQKKRAHSAPYFHPNEGVLSRVVDAMVVHESSIEKSKGSWLESHFRAQIEHDPDIVSFASYCYSNMAHALEIFAIVAKMAKMACSKNDVDADMLLRDLELSAVNAAERRIRMRT